MKTERLDASEASVARAAEALARGELVAFPTETVYGLGARADDPRAVRAIFAAKGRPENKPLIVHVTGAEQARAFVASWPPLAEKLAAELWPGPLTLVLPKAPHVATEVTGGGATVAVRAPAHPLSIRLLARLGVAVAAPSANLSGEAPPTTADEVMAQLAGRIAMVLDGGSTGAPVPSTILDLSVDPPRILREGVVSKAVLVQFGLTSNDRSR